MGIEITQMTAAGGSILGTDKQVLFFDGANTPAGNANFTYDKAAHTLSLLGLIDGDQFFAAGNGSKFMLGYQSASDSYWQAYNTGIRLRGDTYAYLHGNTGTVNLMVGAGGTPQVRLQTTGGLSFGSTYYATDPGANKMIIESGLAIGASAFIGTEKLYVNGNMILPDTSYPNKILMFGVSANSAYITTEATTKGFAFVNAVSGKSGFFTSGAGGVFTFNDTGNSVFGSGTPGTTYLVEILGNMRVTTSAYFATASGGVVIGGTTFVGSEVLSVNGNTVLLGGLGMTGAVTIYKNVTTAGWGLHAINGYGRSVTQTAAVASVATYTVGAADGSFDITCCVDVTASVTHNFSVSVDYTDTTNTARTLVLPVLQLAGTMITAITNVTGAGPYEGITAHLRAKAGTAITIKTTGTFTSVTYNVEGVITQVA